MLDILNATEKARDAPFSWFTRLFKVSAPPCAETDAPGPAESTFVISALRFAPKLMNKLHKSSKYFSSISEHCFQDMRR